MDWAQGAPQQLAGQVVGVDFDAAGNIIVIRRADPPLLKFHPTGRRLLQRWGEGLFVQTHGLYVDREGFIWVADNGRVEGRGQQVIKFNKDGKVLLTLGQAGVAGPGLDTFDQPTEVAVAPNGDIFVADGHGNAPTANARVMKFDKNGTFLKTWGKKGTGPGEFDCVHTLAFDSRGRLFVGDRQNNRIQIFDQEGTFIAEWKQFGRPSGLYIDRNDTLYVADSESRDGAEGYGYNPGARRGIRIGSARDGHVQYFVPDVTPYPYSAGSTSPEGVTTDVQGNIYGAEFTMDVKKYVKK